MTLLLAAFDPPYWLSTLIKVVLVAAIVPTTALIFGMVFLFKVMSWMQSRLGPQEAGPRGSLQLLADGVKFLQKEDIAPNGADLWVFKAAPLVVLMSTFLLYVALPASAHLVVADLDVGIFYVLAVSSLSVIGVLMAGWASASKYSLMGGLRAAGQLIAYELPMVLAVIGVVIQAGTLSLNGIVFAQADGAIFGWDGIGNPYILTQFLGFFIFLIAVQAELTQPPSTCRSQSPRSSAATRSSTPASGSSSSSWPSSPPRSCSPASPPSCSWVVGRCRGSRPPATGTTCSARPCCSPR